METYLGIKIIQAEPQIQYEFTLELEEPKVKEGYKVVYEDGYTSWSPKDVFEKAYILTNNAENKLKQLVELLNKLNEPVQNTEIKLEDTNERNEQPTNENKIV